MEKDGNNHVNETIKCIFLYGNITRKLLSLSLDLFFKILLFQVTFLLFFSTAIFSPYFPQVGLLLQYVALFQSGS